MDNLTKLHILGSGDPFDPNNHILRARLRLALPQEPTTLTVVLHGRKQAGMSTSEALLGWTWLDAHTPYGFTAILCGSSKSTAETMREIAGIVHEDFKQDGDSRDGFTPVLHIIVTNWPYMPRARYLLRKAWESLYPTIPWRKVKPWVRFTAVGGTFTPYWEQQGWRAVPWWLWSVAVRELGAWGKALLDPHDKKLNQSRASAQRF